MSDMRSSHVSHVVRVDFGDLVDVFVIEAQKESRAEYDAIGQFIDKYEFEDRYPQIIATIVQKSCNVNRTQRYYEGYRKGLGNPVPDDMVLI